MGGQSDGGELETRALATALVAGIYLAYFDRAMPAAVAPLVKHDFSLSDTALGFATATAAALAYAAVAIVLALLDDGGRRRRDAALIGGVIAWTIGTVALAFAGTFRLYIAAELLVGGGQAAFVPAAASAIVAVGGGAKLGRATARFTSASTLGRSSALLATGLLIGAIAAAGIALPVLPAAWRTVFLVTALPNAIVAVSIVARLRRAPAGAATAEGGSTAVPPVALIGGFLVAVAPVMLIQAVGAWYPVLLERIAALSPGRAAVFAGAATLIAAPLGQQLGGLLLDRRSERRRRPAATVAPALAVAGIALALLGLVPGFGVAVTVLAGVDLVLGIGVAIGLAGIQALVGNERRRRVNSIFFALVTLVGVGFGPLLAGRLSDRHGATGAALAGALAELAVPALAAAIVGHLLMARGMRYRRGGGVQGD